VRILHTIKQGQQKFWAEKWSKFHHQKSTMEFSESLSWQVVTGSHLAW